jgi:ABC-type nickel/cobalt efflux system permease component RcnA
LIAAIAWLAGAAVAARFGHLVNSAASVALIAFGGWVALTAWRDLAHERAHEHAHAHGQAYHHDHEHKAGQRTALLLILGSSPMVEGIPAFFAAGRYGVGLISVMALVFGVTTIATYVVLSVYSGAGLQKIGLGRFERYGEVLSGAFVMLVGAIFWFWSVL